MVRFHPTSRVNAYVNPKFLKWNGPCLVGNEERPQVAKSSVLP